MNHQQHHDVDDLYQRVGGFSDRLFAGELMIKHSGIPGLRRCRFRLDSP